MNNKYKQIIILFLSFFISLVYIYYFKNITDDELFNYGFSYNITKGIIPYKDFNMIVLPLFNYLFAVILLFWKKLIIYHILISIFISIITYISYKKIGYKSILIFLLLLIYPYTGYNMFCLFLLIILVSNNNNDTINAIIISMMILTKQTLVLLAIPSIIFAKNKKKILCIYVIALLLLVLYTIIYNNYYQLLDYCFLGMMDFTKKNNTGINFFLLLETGIIILLSYMFYKKRKKELIYIILFQIIVFPIVNYFHFIIGFIPVIYYILITYKNNKLLNIFITTSILTFFILMNYGMIFNDDNYLYFEHFKTNNFMKNRAVTSIYPKIINDVDIILKDYKEYTPYILSDYSYLIKLNLNMPISKYDIINQGNMGYKGNKKYIKEIEDYCNKNKCVILLNDIEIGPKKNSIQTDQKIINYVINNYNKVIGSNTINVYVNE